MDVYLIVWLYAKTIKYEYLHRSETKQKKTFSLAFVIENYYGSIVAAQR